MHHRVTISDGLDPDDIRLDLNFEDNLARDEAVMTLTVNTETVFISADGLTKLLNFARSVHEDYFYDALDAWEKEKV